MQDCETQLRVPQFLKPVRLQKENNLFLSKYDSLCESKTASAFQPTSPPPQTSNPSGKSITHVWYHQSFDARLSEVSRL